MAARLLCTTRSVVCLAFLGSTPVSGTGVDFKPGVLSDLFGPQGVDSGAADMPDREPLGDLFGPPGARSAPADMPDMGLGDLFGPPGSGGLGDLFGGLGKDKGGKKGGGGVEDAFAGLFGSGLGDPGPMCPTGQTPVPKDGSHKAYSANGCGFDGLQLPVGFDLVKCCNFHDVCFSVCGVTHKWCEKQFKNCLNRMCAKSDDREACQSEADGMTGMTTRFGQMFYTTSQQESCNCIPNAEAPPAHRAYLRSFLEEYAPEEADDDALTARLAKWKGKEGRMYALLAKKHGPKFVEFKNIAPEFEPIFVPQGGDTPPVDETPTTQLPHTEL